MVKRMRYCCSRRGILGRQQRVKCRQDNVKVMMSVLRVDMLAAGGRAENDGGEEAQVSSRATSRTREWQIT